MTEKEVALIIGAILHDVGKVIYRSGDGRNHSISGYDFLKEDTGQTDKNILDCVRFHHKKNISGAQIENNSNAYIVYIADNIASASDRRAGLTEDYGFSITMPLASVFNIINDNNENLTYSPTMLEDNDYINFPVDGAKEFDKAFYDKVRHTLQDNLKSLNYNSEYVNSLLDVMEATCSYVPSSTNKGELADISLYDHVKMTAAISSCIYKYMEEMGTDDYKEELFTKEKEFYKKDIFCICCIDISGIQDFIYTIASKNALKTLRSRSFYLEILMENIVDEILDRIGLSRANQLYSGGGHSYLLVPNTKKTKDILDTYERELNHWLNNKFDNALFAACGYRECSAENLRNEPDGSYREIFHNVSSVISEKKLKRYTPEDILAFNSKQYDDYERECVVCKRIGQVSESGECSYCSKIKAMSKDILEKELFVISSEVSKSDNAETGGMEFPGKVYMSAYTEKQALGKLESEDYIRAYGINRMYTGKKLSTKIWVGNYTIPGSTFEKLAEASEGVERIAVFRADVDDLGHTFVNGFGGHGGQYETISRTATFSRHMSLFFKKHINSILKNPKYSLTGQTPQRNITIVYSGGDDLFVAGAWNDVIEFAVDIREEFEKYTQGMLTISGGIGIYRDKYPVSAMARETADLEDCAKKYPGKDAIALFDDKLCDKDKDEDMCFGWTRFKNKVLDEKLRVLIDFLGTNNEYGMAFLYNLLELVRNRKEQINIARFAYVLSRMEPPKEKGDEKMRAYKVFSKKMYKWMRDEDEMSANELIAAIYIYVYLNRKEEEDNDNDIK